MFTANYYYYYYYYCYCYYYIFFFYYYYFYYIFFYYYYCYYCYCYFCYKAASFESLRDLCIQCSTTDFTAHRDSAYSTASDRLIGRFPFQALKTTAVQFSAKVHIDSDSACGCSQTLRNFNSIQFKLFLDSVFDSFKLKLQFKVVDFLKSDSQTVNQSVIIDHHHHHHHHSSNRPIPSLPLSEGVCCTPFPFKRMRTEN